MIADFRHANLRICGSPWTLCLVVRSEARAALKRNYECHRICARMGQRHREIVDGALDPSNLNQIDPDRDPSGFFGIEFRYVHRGLRTEAWRLPAASRRL